MILKHEIWEFCPEGMFWDAHISKSNHDYVGDKTDHKQKIAINISSLCYVHPFIPLLVNRGPNNLST